MTQQGNADIGVTGLAVMGRTWPAIWPGTGTPVSLHNRLAGADPQPGQGHGDEGTFVPAESMKEFVASLEPAAGDHHHGQGGRGRPTR